jgi:hypothetical protein
MTNHCEPWRGGGIEIIDIECVLLSFLSKKIVSTKWRIGKGMHGEKVET